MDSDECLASIKALPRLRNKPYGNANHGPLHVNCPRCAVMPFTFVIPSGLLTPRKQESAFQSFFAACREAGLHPE